MTRETGSLHFLTPLWRRPQRAFVALFRRYFDRAAGWVVLTTRGRRTGLPREVLLPCRRIEHDVLVLSAYGHRSDWMRNLVKNPRVSVTCNGRDRSARAEIIEEVARRRALLWKDPFSLPAFFAILQALSWTLLRPVFFVLAWSIVRSRPLVLMHLEETDDDQGRPGATNPGGPPDERRKR
jgi:deazaflavin-dependent oxidoreductase (nitroreductase family)